MGNDPKPDAGRPGTEGEDRRTREENAGFLVDEFGINAPEAADLVANDAGDAEAITEHEFEREREKDPLEDVPAPEDPDQGPVERVGHHMQKEVRHRETEDPS